MQYNKEMYAPGQVQESLLGFDGIFYQDEKFLLWPLFNRIPIFSMPSLINGVWAPDIEERLFSGLEREVGILPKMRINLIFQYKRPEYMTGHKANEWNYWNEPYYRYLIDEEQLNILINIQEICDKSALVLYAAPALCNLDELFNSHISSTILENTNFKEAISLLNHTRNTFVKSGLFSKAFSEPQEIPNFDFISFLNETGKVESHNFSYNEKNYMHNKELIMKVAQTVDNISRESYLSKHYNYWIKQSQKYEHKYPCYYYITVMYIFRLLTGIQWIMI